MLISSKLPCKIIWAFLHDGWRLDEPWGKTKCRPGLLLLTCWVLLFCFSLFFNVASGRFACNISLPETHFTTQWRMFFTYLLLQANRLSYFALNMYLLISLYFSLAILLQLRAHDKEKSVSENCQRVWNDEIGFTGQCSHWVLWGPQKPFVELSDWERNQLRLT